MSSPTVDTHQPQQVDSGSGDTVASLKRQLQQVSESASLREHELQKSVDRAREIFDLNLQRKEKEIEKKYKDDMTKGASEVRRLEAVVGMRDNTISDLTAKLRSHTEDKVSAVRHQKADQMAAVEDANSHVKRLRGQVEMKRFEAEEATQKTAEANVKISELHSWIKDWVGYINLYQLNLEVVNMEEVHRKVVSVEERLEWELLKSKYFSPFILRYQEAKSQQFATVKEIHTTVRSEILLDAFPRKVLDRIITNSTVAKDPLHHHQEDETTTPDLLEDDSSSSGMPPKASRVRRTNNGRKKASNSSPRSPLVPAVSPIPIDGTTTTAATTTSSLYHDCLGLMVPTGPDPPHRSAWGLDSQNTSCSHLSTPYATSLSIMPTSSRTMESLSRTPNPEDLILWAIKNKTELKTRIAAYNKPQPPPHHESPVLGPASSLNNTVVTNFHGSLTNANGEEDFGFGDLGGGASIVVISPQRKRSSGKGGKKAATTIGGEDHEDGDEDGEDEDGSETTQEGDENTTTTADTANGGPSEHHHQGGGGTTPTTTASSSHPQHQNSGQYLLQQLRYPTLDIGALSISPNASVSRVNSGSTIVSQPHRGSGVRTNSASSSGYPRQPHHHARASSIVLSRSVSVVDPTVTTALHTSALDVQMHVKEYTDVTSLLLQYLITHFILPQSLHVEAMQIQLLQMTEKLVCLEGLVVDKLNGMAARVNRTETQCQRVAARVDTRQHDPKRHFMYKRRPTSPNMYTVPSCLLPEDGSPKRTSLLQHHRRAVQFAHPSVNTEVVFDTEDEELQRRNTADASTVEKDGGVHATVATATPSTTSEETLEDIITTYEEDLQNTSAKLAEMKRRYTGGCTKDQLSTLTTRLQHGERDRETLHSQLNSANKKIADLIEAQSSAAILIQQQQQTIADTASSAAPPLTTLSTAHINQQQANSNNSLGGVVSSGGAMEDDKGSGGDGVVPRRTSSSSGGVPPSSTGRESPFNDQHNSPQVLRPVSGGGGGTVAFSPDVSTGRLGGGVSRKHISSARLTASGWRAGGGGAGNTPINNHGEGSSSQSTTNTAAHNNSSSVIISNQQAPPLVSALSRRGSTGNPSSPSTPAGIPPSGGNAAQAAAAALQKQVEAASSEISRLERDNKDMKTIIKRLRKEARELEQQKEEMQGVGSGGVGGGSSSTANSSMSGGVVVVPPTLCRKGGGGSPPPVSANLPPTFPSSMMNDSTSTASALPPATLAELESLTSQISELQMQLLGARRDRDTWRQRTDTALAQAAHSEEQRLKSVHRYLGLMGRREEETSQWLIKAASTSSKPHPLQHQQQQQIEASPPLPLDASTTSNVSAGLPAILPPTSPSTTRIEVDNNTSTTSKLGVIGAQTSSTSPTTTPTSAGVKSNNSSVQAIRGEVGVSVADQIKPGGASIVEDLLARREEQLRLIQVERKLMSEGAKKAVAGLANQAAELSYKEEVLAAKAKTLRDRELTIGQAEDKVAHALRSVKLKNGGRPLLLPRTSATTTNSSGGVGTMKKLPAIGSGGSNSSDREGSVDGGGESNTVEGGSVLPPLSLLRRTSTASSASTLSTSQQLQAYTHPQRYSPLDKQSKQ